MQQPKPHGCGTFGSSAGYASLRLFPLPHPSRDFVEGVRLEGGEGVRPDQHTISKGGAREFRSSMSRLPTPFLKMHLCISRACYSKSGLNLVDHQRTGGERENKKNTKEEKRRTDGDGCPSGICGITHSTLPLSHHTLSTEFSRRISQRRSQRILLKEFLFLRKTWPPTE